MTVYMIIGTNLSKRSLFNKGVVMSEYNLTQRMCKAMLKDCEKGYRLLPEVYEDMIVSLSKSFSESCYIDPAMVYAEIVHRILNAPIKNVNDDTSKQYHTIRALTLTILTEITKSITEDDIIANFEKEDRNEQLRIFDKAFAEVLSKYDFAYSYEDIKQKFVSFCDKNEEAFREAYKRIYPRKRIEEYEKLLTPSMLVHTIGAVIREDPSKIHLEGFKRLSERFMAQCLRREFRTFERVK